MAIGTQIWGPIFGTGNGRAPYVDWELAMGDD